MLGNPTIVAGTYPGPAQAGLLRPNEQQWLWQGQLYSGAGAGLSARADGSNPSASIAVCLGRIQDGYPNGASLAIFFTDVNGNASSPGNFEVDWQNADDDTDAAFVNVQSLVNTGSLNSSFRGRIELPLMYARFMRVYLKSLTNQVYVWAKVTR